MDPITAEASKALLTGADSLHAFMLLAILTLLAALKNQVTRNQTLVDDLIKFGKENQTVIVNNTTALNSFVERLRHGDS